MKNQKARNIRPTRKLLTCALASCLMLGMAPSVFAQSTGAILRGSAAADATITVTNVDTGLTRSVQATNGNYSLGGLPPGTYRIDVDAAGQVSSQAVTLQVGQTATLNLDAVTTPAESGDATTLGTVTVTAPILVETKTSEIATYVSQKQIDALPQSSRNFLAFADTVPGMIFETGSEGSARLRGGAQNSNGINVFIDGVGQKNYVLKGGISGQDSSNGNPFPQLAIGEYKVITSNYKAEYDQISSAAVTAVTKSGTNEFDGSFFWDSTNEQWRKPTLREERENGGKKTPSGETQYGAAFGGPILKDQLFFFVTYEAKDFERPKDITAPSLNPFFDPADLTPELASQLGSDFAPFNQDTYFGKLTWQPGGDHLVELSAKRREEEELTSFGGRDARSWGSSKTNDSTRVDLRWQWSAMNWMNDAHFTFEDDFWSPRPLTIGPGYQIVHTPPNNTNDGELILNVGGGRDFQDKGQTGYSLQDDLTYFGFENHTMKMGVKFKSIEISAFEQQPYNPQYRVDYYENLAEGRTTLDSFIPYRVTFASPIGGVDRNITSRNKQFGVYFQDDWAVNDHLTLNLGLRWDYEQTPSFEDYQTSAGLVTALRGWTNIHGPNVDYDIEDYISTGSNRDSFKDAWQPRLGFSYDLFADQRHVIFGGAGRSYDRNLFDYLAYEQAKNSLPTYQRTFNTTDHPCTPGVGDCLAWNSSYLDPQTLNALVAANPNLGGEVFLMNNDLKTPYSDQFSIGMRNVFTVAGHDWNSSATISRVNSYDGILFALGNRWPDGSFRNPANPTATWGGQAFGSPVPGYGNLFLGHNGIETKLNQLLLSLEKPFTPSSPWAFTLAYTFSDAEENRVNAANGDELYLRDYPISTGQPFTTSLGIPKHRLVATGIADFWGMTLSSKLTLASPTPKDAVNCHNTTSFDNCFFDPFTPDETIGFKQFDIALQKEWSTGTDVKLRVRGDVFNLFNWTNYTDYETWRGGPIAGEPNGNPNFGRVNGNGSVWPPRMFKLSFGLSW